MPGYSNNAECILAYLDMFISFSEGDTEKGQIKWLEILSSEHQTPDNVILAPLVLKKRFGLQKMEFLLVMASLSLEMDGKLRGAFRKRYGLSLPTIEYGMQLIEPVCPNNVKSLAVMAGFNSLCGVLLAVSEYTGYPLERPLILCRAALAFLTGTSFAEITGVTPLIPETEWLPVNKDALEKVKSWSVSDSGTVLYLCGPKGSGRRSLLCQAYGMAVCVELKSVALCSSVEAESICREATVTAVLMRAPICAIPSDNNEHLRRLKLLCSSFDIPLVVLVESESELAEAEEVIRLPRKLTWNEMKMAWEAFVPKAGSDSVPEGAMTLGAVRETASIALRYAGRPESVTLEHTRKALRQRGGAMEFGIRYENPQKLEDMTLPENVLKQLELICETARNVSRLSQWGLGQNKEGVTAVFYGPSGTGKTMASSAIAGKLGMPLLRTDLSQIMDKYVGETEKHLSRLMQSARENHCVLFFDEADALFGRRSSSASGQERYANISTSYLLQEIENYEGVVLLATNLLSNFDEAFLRRLQYIVRFPLPDAALREILWQRALPEERREGEIPFSVLAKVELSPARIYSVVRNAAVTAIAQDREKTDTDGIFEALMLEVGKDGKTLPGEVSSWVKKR